MKLEEFNKPLPLPNLLFYLPKKNDDLNEPFMKYPLLNSL